MVWVADRQVVEVAPLVVEIALALLAFSVAIFFERKRGRGSPYSDFGFLKIRTQIRVCGDLNLGGWVVHPLP
jgi:hypothetical protein